MVTDRQPARMLLIGPESGPAGLAEKRADQAGWQTRQAGDGFQAIEAILQDTQLEAALLDMEAFQPRIEAIVDTLNAVRPQLPIYLICPVWLEPEARRLASARMNTHYLIDPVSQDDLPAPAPAAVQSAQGDLPAGIASPPAKPSDALFPPGLDALLERVSGPVEPLLYAAAKWICDSLGPPTVEVFWLSHHVRWPQDGDILPAVSSNAIRAEPCRKGAAASPADAPSADYTPPASAQVAELRNHEGKPAGRLVVHGSADGTVADAVAVRRAAELLSRLFVINQRFASLQNMAFTDHLSGAYNRRYLMYFLERLIRRAQHERFGITLLMFDIDDFKRYNDTYGHVVGDEIIAEIACLMRQTSREHDVVARIGGDEFAVLFWDAGPPRQPGSQHPTEAAAFAERFQKLLASHVFGSLGPDARGTLTLSGGLAHYPTDGSTAADLLAHAAGGLKGAKQTGKAHIYVVGQAPDSGMPLG